MAEGPCFALDNCIIGLKLSFVLCSYGVAPNLYNHWEVQETMDGVFKSTTNSDTQDQS